VTDQQPMTESAKITGRRSYTPWGIEPPPMLEPLHQSSTRVKDRNKSNASPMLFIRAPTFNLGESNYEVPADILDIERRIALRYSRIAKCPVIGFHAVKARIENSNTPALEVRDVEARTMFGLGNGTAFVDRFAGTVQGNYRIGEVDGRVPTGNSPVFGDKQEHRWFAADLKTCGVVKDGPSRCRSSGSIRSRNLHHQRLRHAG